MSEIIPVKLTVLCFLSVFHVLQRVMRGVDRSRVRGVGFDATCSLVVLDQSFQPVSVTRDGK